MGCSRMGILIRCLVELDFTREKIGVWTGVWFFWGCWWRLFAIWWFLGTAPPSITPQTKSGVGDKGGLSAKYTISFFTPEQGFSAYETHPSCNSFKSKAMSLCFISFSSIPKFYSLPKTEGTKLSAMTSKIPRQDARSWHHESGRSRRHRL